MGSISTDVGLVSGLNIKQLVDQLISLEARPANLLQQQIDKNSVAQSALQTLSLSIVSAKLSASQLTSSSAFASRSATSSSDALSVTAGPKATTGTFSFVPKQRAASQQLLSVGFASSTATVGTGTITIKPGGFVDEPSRLSALNGGEGVAVGSIRITDAAGNSATLDLGAAVTIRDVVDAVNGSADIDVTASAEGGRLKLVDTSGGAGVLAVGEVGGGSTASDLGLTSLSRTGNTYTGQEILALGSGLDLRTLNNNNGVRTVAGNDLRITLGGSTNFDVDLSSATTIGDVIDTIETATSGRVQVTTNGNKLELTDTDAGATTVAVSSLNSSLAAFDLGIEGSSGTSTLSGRNVLGGLDSVLLNNLNGGFAGGADTQLTAGTVNVNGTAVDLSSATTLEDVVSLVNAQSGTTNVTATLNAARNGLVLTHGAGSSFTVSDVSGNTAAFLNIDGASDASGVLASGDLNARFVSESTLLANFNGGVAAGKIRVIDGFGTSRVIDLTQSDDDALGDVIEEINATFGSTVVARIADNGDGLVLQQVGGSGTLQVLEEGGTTAADLGILGTAVGGIIDGSLTRQVSVGAGDSLATIVNNLNGSGAPIQASLLNDGSGLNPVRLSLTSSRSGLAGQVLVDTGALNFNFSEITRARDAVLLLGDPAAGQAVQLTESTNSFDGVVSGVTIDVQSTTTSAVSVTISQDEEAIVDAVRDFLDSFNSAKKVIREFASFNPETNERGPLFTDSAVRLAERQLNDFANGVFGNTGSSISTLGELGIALNDQGDLEFDEAEFLSAFRADPKNVENFFAAADNGVSDRFESLADDLTGDEGSLTVRTDTLTSTIARQNQSIDAISARLEVHRTRLLNQFYAMELILAQFQAQQTTLNQLAGIAVSAAGTQQTFGI